MNRLILLVSTIAVSAFAEHLSESRHDSRGEVAPRTRYCFHAALMQVHRNLLGDFAGLKDPISRGTTELKYDGKTSAEVSEMVTYRSDDDCEIVFAFRGTKELNDLLADLDAEPESSGRFHRGFFEAARGFRRDVLRRLEGNGCRREGGPRVTFTGHSLGGTVAQAVANVVLRDKLPLKTDVVAFGAPRLVMASALTNGGHADRFPVEHYFIDRDPVTTIPLSPPYADLTTSNFRFREVPITKGEENLGQSMLQNHLPTNYVAKMTALCEGKEAVTKVKRITHSTMDALATITAKLVRDAAMETGRKTGEALDAAVGLLPDRTPDGARLPTGTETVEAFFTAVTKPNLPNRSAWNGADGASFAKDEACKQWGWSTSATERGRAHFCNGARTGFNVNAQNYCAGKCGSADYARAGCTRGCVDVLHQLCVGGWRCKD